MLLSQALRFGSLSPKSRKSSDGGGQVGGQVEAASADAGQRVLVPAVPAELVAAVEAQDTRRPAAGLPAGTRPQAAGPVGQAAQLALHTGGAVDSSAGKAQQVGVGAGRFTVVADWLRGGGVTGGGRVLGDSVSGTLLPCLRPHLWEAARRLHLVALQVAVGQVDASDVMEDTAVQAALETKRRRTETAAEVMGSPSLCLQRRGNDRTKPPAAGRRHRPVAAPLATRGRRAVVPVQVQLSLCVLRDRQQPLSVVNGNLSKDKHPASIASSGRRTGPLKPTGPEPNHSRS